MSPTTDALGWSVEPIAPALGVVVHGPEFSEPLTPEADAALQALVYEHLVVAVAEANISPSMQVKLGRLFGEPLVHPFLDAIDGHPEVLSVVKEPDAKETFGGEFWHADITFLDPPASVSLLQAVELPSVGGDTLFANQYLALETLSVGMKDMLGTLRAVHVYPGMDEGVPHTTATHPVIRRHPVSGRPALFVNPAFVTRFESMTTDESKPLLEQLYHHQVRPEFVGRVRWSDDMLTLWDNRAVLHYAMNDYFGRRRELRRVTSMERPVPV